MSDFEVREESSAKYTATLTDENGDAIPLANIDAITLTLFLPESSALTVINSRDDQDVKNTNNVSIHATSGLLTWSIQPGDTEIIESDLDEPYELHRALFKFTYGGGKKGSHTVDLYVKNLKKIT